MEGETHKGARMRRELERQLRKTSLLDGYLATQQMLPYEEFMQDNLLNIIFEQMSYEIADAIIKRKKELPNEECLFVLTCKIYKFSDYKKAHPLVFKKEVRA